jgi:phosphogluconate dehydratase
MNNIVEKVTQRIAERSAASRENYLHQLEQWKPQGVKRKHLSCGNLAHGFAGCGAEEKSHLAGEERVNLGIVTAYNDMLSAHKTYENYPEKIRNAALLHGGVAQVAGGVPAMCDGVTQGQVGMELSLLSRDVIALSTAIALSHDMFDGSIGLGICDKIVPGITMGFLRFGHLPALFIPGGPMETGISNEEKAQIRQDYAEGKIDRAALLKGESDSYHSPGTCTFYGTANSNQMLMEMMGLQLPGSSFINPGTPLREKLTEKSVAQLIQLTRKNSSGIGYQLNEKSFVNALIGLLATGGSTNHTIHLMAIAKTAGIHLNWEDLSDLSGVIPLLARVYPNGAADVNHFHAAGGVPFIVRSLLKEGLLHEDVQTIMGRGMHKYAQEPKLIDGEVVWDDAEDVSGNSSILRPANDPFQKTGGLELLQGNLGRAVIKTSAVPEDHHIIEAPAVVFDEQDDLMKAFKANKLNRDFVAVLPFQGPKTNGMPELHKLTPVLTILQKRGYRVALVTDGRMSGASGKVPAAIHLWPEASDGGLLASIQDGDLIKVDAQSGEISAVPGPGLEPFENRTPRKLERYNTGMGRELFDLMRSHSSNSEAGASAII